MRSVTTDLSAARDFLDALPRDRPVWVVAETLAVARTSLRADALRRGPRSFAEAFTLDGLAGALARPAMEREGAVALPPLGLPALVAELALAKDTSQLGRYAASRQSPGLVRALSRALAELLDADLSPAHVGPHDPLLATLHGELRALLRSRRLVDRAGRYERALARLAGGEPIPAVVLLCPRVRTALEAQLVHAVCRASEATLAVIPAWDLRARAALGDDVELRAAPASAFDEIAGQLFGPAVTAHPSGIRRFSARSEMEECAELVSRVLRLLAEGDEPSIAIVLPDPAAYRAPLGEALTRAGLSAVAFAGARRPDPAGRALLSLIDCALEGLSARAFAEYLSFAVLPAAEGGVPPPAWPDGERVGADDDAEEEEPAEGEAGPVRAGTLQTPARFERILVDAAVTQGGSARWRARLAGLRERVDRAAQEADDRVAVEALERQRSELLAFEAFALPLVEELEALPGQHGARAPLVAHLERLSALATRALRRPRRVLSVLADLRRRAEDAELTLGELRSLLDQPLRDVVVARDPSAAGLEVLGLDEVRGRSFDHVLVPGLAERVFPRPVREDPILGDALRETLAAVLAQGEPGPAPRLATREDRVEEERDVLRAIVSATRRTLTVSHARVDERGRRRLPSLYLLELARAAEGRLPPLDDVAPLADRTALFTPKRPEHAIDPIEHGLATLSELYLHPDRSKGRARHLFEAHPGLERAVRQRWARDQRDREYSADGLVVTDAAGKALLARHRFSERAYSATALESFAECPYRFYLKAILRLGPVERPEPLIELDPLLFGSLTHTLQFRTLTRLRREGVSWEAGSSARALAVLEEERAALERELVEDHVLAVPGALDDDLARLGRDARRWLADLLSSGWTPLATELAFGLSGPAADVERDDASQDEPVQLAVGIRLRGSIDLVEGKPGALRATDHKTGRPKVEDGARIAGGRSLQPALYAQALEAMLAAGPLRERAQAVLGVGSHAVTAGRLSYCTQKGGFTAVDVPHDAEAAAALTVLKAAIEGELDRGRLLRRPLIERGEGRPSCTYCDYLVVCGPDEASRAAKKKAPEGLVRLRSTR